MPGVLKPEQAVLLLHFHISISAPLSRIDRFYTAKEPILVWVQVSPWADKYLSFFMS